MKSKDPPGYCSSKIIQVDVILTKRAFNQARIANDLTLARTAEEALAILRKEGEYASRAKPDLILLDLNLPGMHGKELLEILKSDGHLKRIPVIILSSSRANQDVVQSYDLNASGYIIKPVNISEFEEVVNGLVVFWFSLVVMPDEEDMK